VEPNYLSTFQFIIFHIFHPVFIPLFLYSSLCFLLPVAQHQSDKNSLGHSHCEVLKSLIYWSYVFLILLLFYIDGGLIHCSRSKSLLVFIFQMNEFPTYDCDFPRVNYQYMGVCCSISIVSLRITLLKNQLMMAGGPLCCELRPPPKVNSEVI